MESSRQMAALHALQDHVVARLQRQMQMRHQPLLGRDHLQQLGVGLDGIDRGQPETPDIRHLAQDRLHEPAELRAARQVGAVAGEVDARQHDLGIAVAGESLHLLDHRAHRHGARIAAAIGDDAEGAAVVAAVLHLHEGARASLDRVDHVRGRLAHGKDVVDARLLEVVDAEVRQRAVVVAASASPRCRARGRPRPWPRSREGSVCAAQPVTMILAFGFSRRALRIDCFAWRTASAVTAQVLKITAPSFNSPRPAAVASRRMTSDS